MSIAGIGSSGPGNLSQVLSSLLSRLDTTSNSSDSTDSTSTTQSSTSVSKDGNLTGHTKPSLSSMILGTLMGLQQQSASSTSSSTSTASTSATSSSTASSSSSSSSGVQALFSSMDTDGDGVVSQAELESYLENLGATQDQADSLYSALDTSDSKDGISEDEMEAQAPPPPPPGPPPGGPPPENDQSASSTNSIGSQLSQLFDSDDDGTVTKSEFTSFVTAHGGTETQAANEFAALDSSNSGSLTSDSFQDAIDKLQNSYTNDPYAPIMTLLSAFAQNTTAGSTVSVSA